MTTPTTDTTEPADEFDPHEIASDPDARAAAEEAVQRGDLARQALLDAAHLVAGLAAATLGHAGAAGAAGGSTSQRPEPTAQQRAAAQAAKRFSAGRTQPPTSGRPPTARTAQAAAQIARRGFTPRDKS